MEELQEHLKDADVNKYISALFKAEEAFTKELQEYCSDEKSRYVPPDVEKIVSGSLLKKLPLKYRLFLKLPWQNAIEIITGFLKELGDGSTEEVLVGLAREYMGVKR